MSDRSNVSARRAATAPRRALHAYQTVVWDWNGTLLDDLDYCLQIANEIFGERGLAALSRERYREIFDFPVRLYYERAGLILDEAGFRALSVDFCARFERQLHGVPLFSRAAELVQLLATRGTRQLVLSNAEQGSLLRQIERWGWGATFE